MIRFVSESVQAGDPLPRATSLVERADERGVPVRIIGGLAVRALCPQLPPRAVDAQDLDLVSVSKSSAEVGEFLAGEGFDPDTRFNSFHGDRQLRFAAPDASLSIDVMLDRLQMSHELELAERIERIPLTIDVGDLLLSKLQIFELNDKDVHDILHLLSCYPVAEGDQPRTIGLDRIGELVGSDWGWWRTTTRNLEHIIEREPDRLQGCDHDPLEQARALREHAEEVPKTMRWKLRARVGEKVRWYELPEEVEDA